MDKKSKVLILILILAILISLFFTYKRAFVDKHFKIIDSEDNLTEEE